MATPDIPPRRETQIPWPPHGRFLIPGVNDTWNEFQKFCKGTKKLLTSNDWRAAKAALHAQYQQFIAEGGIPLQIEYQASRYLIVLTLLNQILRNNSVTCFVSGEELHSHTTKLLKSSGSKKAAMVPGWWPRSQESMG
jgi:hypothetical protein